MRIIQAWGMTETSPVGSVAPRRPASRATTSGPTARPPGG